MKKLFPIILLFVALGAFGATGIRSISGTVYDESKQPLPGVSVTVKGATEGVQTDAAGHYQIKVPYGYHHLIFSFIGYQTQEVRIGKKDRIDVYLRPQSNELDEVVVTGYTSKRHTSVTGSITTINAASLANTSPAPVQLQGQTSGVTITRGVSAPNYNAPGMQGYNNQNSSTTDESYQVIHENGFQNVADNPLSTFSTDVDAASYSNVRRYINNGQLPPAGAVRIEEMVNYFKYNLPGPSGSQPVAIHTELSMAPWNVRHLLLRIGLKAKTVDPAKLPPSNLVFLIDVSGSMNEPNKLPLVKAAMKMLTGQLRGKDKVAIVTYAGEAGIALDETPGDQKQKIMDAIDQLNADGSTNGGEGIKMAYQLAKQNFIKQGNNRIILATDGDFNVGPNGDEDMEQLIVKERDSKVAISIMGFGMGNLKDSKMERMADKGNGNYAYIDNIQEAKKALVTEFAGTMYTVAKDVKLQLEFNPAKVQAYRLLGYEDRMLNKEDFNNDRKDAGDMVSGHTVTALYEIVPAGIKDNYIGNVDPLKYQKQTAQAYGKSSDEWLTIKFRYKSGDSPASRLSEAVVKGAPEKLRAATNDFRFAAAVAGFGMLLRNSEYKEEANYGMVIRLAKEARGDDAEGYRAEFARLAESTEMLAKNTLASN